MKLTNKVPGDWIDLQNQVARLFNEAGYHAESPKIISLVRGKKEVDVFVRANHEILNTLICECKYWNKPIPEETVHSFRTVVADSGSMLGIIISKVGFQKGAKEAAEKSNVILKTWEEFQQMLLLPWTIRTLRKISLKVYSLGVYTDPLDCDKQLKQLDYEEYKKINDKYFLKYLDGRILLSKIEEERLYENDYIEYDGHCFDALEVFFQYYTNIIDEAIEEYSKFFAPCPVDNWKFQFSKSIFLLEEGLI